MSFGGAVSAMLSSLKNNKRDRPSAFKKMKDYEDGDYKTRLHFENNSSQKQLDELREKLQQENKVRFRRNVVIFVISIVIAIYVIGFVKF